MKGMLSTFTFSTKHCLVPDTEIEKIGRELNPYLEKLRGVAADSTYSEPESSLHLPEDKKLRQEVTLAIERHRTNNLRFVVVVGIGGSNLGTMAVYDALRGLPGWQNPQQPQLLFADTVEPVMMDRFGSMVQALNDPNEAVICIISKSGNTTETIANASILVQALTERWPGKQHHVIAITDEGSRLWNLAHEQGWTTLAIPKLVGGRFSVLSAVGLFPLALAGIDIEQLHDGARDMRDQCLRESNNPSVQSAAILFYHNQHGKSIHDTFLFRSHLESFGRWYRQLTGESLGKEHDARGNTVHAGFTPLVSIGSTDLHSVGQLYLGGPHDKVTTFIYATPANSASVPLHPLTTLVDGIAKKPITTILEAILRGITEAYARRKLPFMKATLSEISAYSLGQLLQWKMVEIMLLGKLLRVNAFDQPNVEEYKAITRSILELS